MLTKAQAAGTFGLGPLGDLQVLGRYLQEPNSVASEHTASRERLSPAPTCGDKAQQEDRPRTLTPKRTGDQPKSTGSFTAGLVRALMAPMKEGLSMCTGKLSTNLSAS